MNKVIFSIVVVGITLLLFSIVTNHYMLGSYDLAQAFRAEDGQRSMTIEKAPVSISGDNVYVAWWTNNTENGDGEVMFRASNDSGATFGDKINLSNNTNNNSVDAMIDSDGDSVVVTWWERNQTSNEPVTKISNDAGHTFGPLLHLSQNKTIENNEG